MKIELGVTLYHVEELPLLDYGLESILDKTQQDICTTLYLSRYTDEIYDKASKIAEKFEINFEVRGDNCCPHYNNELRHRAFDVNDADTALTIQPDTVFTQKDIFDSIVDRASDSFDSNFYVCVSSDHPKDDTPLGIVFHTKLGWEKVGCDDINFYPQAGGEQDFHRRCYLAHGLDPNDKKLYMAPIKGKTDVPWAHRIRCKEFLHVGKPWNYLDPRLSLPDRANYSTQILFENVLWDRWIPYYLEKWGGVLGFEKFIKPFNDKKNSIQIPWETSLNPYPETRYINLRGLVL
jgi:hypothetical protein